MTKLLGRSLRAARERAGLTQAAVAEKLEVSRAAVGQWESGLNEPSTANLLKVCSLLNISVAAATGGLVRETAVQLPNNMQADADDQAYFVRDHRPEMREVELELMKEAEIQAALRPMARSIPIIVTARVYSEHEDVPEFIVGTNIVDICPKPPGLMHAKGLEAFYLVDDKNAPKFEEGDLVFIHAGKKAKINDYALVRLDPDPDQNGDRGAYFGKLLSHSFLSVEIEQLNPKKIISIKSETIERLDPVLSINELFGK